MGRASSPVRGAPSGWLIRVHAISLKGPGRTPTGRDGEIGQNRDFGRPYHPPVTRRRLFTGHWIRSADCGGPGECASDVRSRRIAPARKELRNGSSKSERESTSGRSTNYGSGHLIRVFRDIGRIFSLLILLGHPSPVGHPAVRERSKARTEFGFVQGKNGFNCVSCGTHRRWTSLATCHSPKREPRPKGAKAGSREPSSRANAVTIPPGLLLDR
jgi:hypothetical protein